MFESLGRGYGKDAWVHIFTCAGREHRPHGAEEAPWAATVRQLDCLASGPEGGGRFRRSKLGGGYGKDPWKVVSRGRRRCRLSSPRKPDGDKERRPTVFTARRFRGLSPSTFRIPERRWQTGFYTSAFLRGRPFSAAEINGIALLLLFLWVNDETDEQIS